MSILEQQFKPNQLKMENDVLDETPTGNIVYSDYWSRLGASVLDFIFLFIPMFALSMYNTFYLKNFAFIALVILIMTLYKPLLEYYYGATWGKMIVKIKVVDAKNEMISIGQAFIRSFPGIIGLFIGIYSTYVMHNNDGFLDAEGFIETSEWFAENAPTGIAAYRDWIPTGILFLSSLLIFADAQRQAFHDKVAKTFVIKNL